MARRIGFPVSGRPLGPVAPIRLGDWVECRGAVTKLTRSLAFVRGAMTVDGAAVMTCWTVPGRWRPG